MEPHILERPDRFQVLKVLKRQDVFRDVFQDRNLDVCISFPDFMSIVIYCRSEIVEQTAIVGRGPGKAVRRFPGPRPTIVVCRQSQIGDILRSGQGRSEQNVATLSICHADDPKMRQPGVSGHLTIRDLWQFQCLEFLLSKF